VLAGANSIFIQKVWNGRKSGETLIHPPLRGVTCTFCEATFIVRVVLVRAENFDIVSGFRRRKREGERTDPCWVGSVAEAETEGA
jgi:hypothetical protein